MAATHGMVLSLIHGVVISIVCTAIMPRFLRSFTSDETVIAMGVTYSRVAFMFAVVIMAAMAFEKIFQAVGRMNITMIGLMGGSVCNIISGPAVDFSASARSPKWALPVRRWLPASARWFLSSSI